jgi:hypothetical protein
MTPGFLPEAIRAFSETIRAFFDSATLFDSAARYAMARRAL